MKHNIAISLLLAAICLLPACKHPDVEYMDFESFRVTSVKTGKVMDEAGSLNPEIRLPDLGDWDPDTKVASTSATEIVKELLGVINNRSIVQIAGTYSGHDIDGKTELIQSGKLLLPAEGPVKNLMIVSHFTIGADFECPSECFPLEGILASKGYAVAIADYIGFGVTSGRIHPYMHTRSTSQSVVDMALAVKPYLKHIGREPESEEVILLGYSQGGSTTMAVMNLIQRKYNDILPIKKVYVGGGPYDLNATFDFSMETDITGIPCAIPMIVQGVSEGETLHLDMNDFFQPYLLEHYDEWINSKKYTVGMINKMMGANSMHEIMTDSGRDKTAPHTARLYKALFKNSVLNFEPRSPIFMLHSTQDQTVPFINALKAEQYFKGLCIDFDFGDYGSHSSGAIKFLLTAAKDL